MNSNSIELLSIKNISKNEILITIYKTKYEDLLKLKTVYDVEIVSYSGLYNFNNIIYKNRIILILIMLSISFMFFLSNIVFSIDIINNDSKMKNQLLLELKDLGISKYKFKKRYETLEKIKNEILSKHKTDLEWIEIEESGTKYIIRYEPRVIKNKESETSYRNIVAKKDAVIKSLNISKGTIVKNTNTFVKKGEVIVSGYVMLNDEVKSLVISKGVVYGEVWYKVSINYPINYESFKKTGKENKALVLKVLNNYINIFNFTKYKEKDIKNNIILKNKLLPFMLIYQEQIELKKVKKSKKDIYNDAVLFANKKVKEKLNEDEYIKDFKVLNKIETKNNIKLEIFFSVIENITEYENMTS